MIDLKEAKDAKELFDFAKETRKKGTMRMIMKFSKKYLKDLGCGKFDKTNRRVHFYCGKKVFGIKMLCKNCKKIKKILEKIIG